ncbi:MAG: thioredoxin domain-containing protein [Chloroflexi bacterium]|nr:thioredoxin domain-containing protein [Chloroflexota bacterium]
MQQLSRFLRISMLVLIVSLVSTLGAGAMDEGTTSNSNPVHSGAPGAAPWYMLNTDALAGGSGAPGLQELGETFTWREAGLSFPYPQDWELVLQQGYDAVLIAPQDEGSEEIAYITMQSTSVDPDQSLEQNMTELLPDLADDLTESSLGDLDALSLDISDENQHTRLITFSAADGYAGLMVLSSSASIWDEWEGTFETIVSEAEFTPLELDHEALNAQMLESFEADGTLTVGDPEAPIVVVEFLDFSCGHCANFSHQMDRLVQDFVPSGEARVTFNILVGVGGEFSRIAAQAKYCGVTLGYGWDMHGLIFAEYTTKGPQEAYTQDNLIEAVENADFDIDSDAFAACMEEADFSEVLTANQARASELEVTGTPTVFVGEDGGELTSPPRLLILLYQEINSLLE